MIAQILLPSIISEVSVLLPNRTIGCAIPERMSISKDEFEVQCSKFTARCKELGDTWRLLGEYHGSIREIDALDRADIDRLILTKIELRVRFGEVHSHEYNVVYSDSYQVPVMYFTISRQDGSLLDYKETLSNLVGIAADDLNQVVNQVDHPILFRPFFMIHPCKTKQFMEPHKNLNPHHYLICWLSTVGSILGLELDKRFADLTTSSHHQTDR